MKRRRMIITDLNTDVLKNIMVHVASSSNGAVNVARILCVCKAFRESAQDFVILTKTNFDDLKLPRAGASLWKSNGLLKKCACAGNISVFWLFLDDLEQRTQSIMLYLHLPQAYECLREVALRRYCTRSRLRAVQPCLKFVRRLRDNLETNSKEFKEIIEMLREVKLALQLKQQQGISEHYGRTVDVIELMEEFITTKILSVFQMLLLTVESVESLV